MLSAAGLLLVCPPQAINKSCTLFLSTREHDRGFTKDVSRRFKALSESNIKVKSHAVFVSKRMVGWQASLQPRSPGAANFTIAIMSSY